mgnify:CR=1 FL=1
MGQKAIKTFSMVFLITLFAKILGLLRDIFFANFFGTGYEATAFFAASRIPTQLLDIGLGAAIASTFIPVFNEIMQKENKEKANVFAGNFINIIAVIATIISVLGIIFAPQVVSILAGGFDEVTFNLTVELIRITFPMMIFTAIAFSLVGFLQSYGQFNVPAMISAISNIAIILYLILFRESFGIHGIAVFMLVAWALQVIVQIPFAKKYGYRFKWKINFKDENIKKVFKLALPIIISTSVLPINILVSTAIASSMENGAVAALEYSYKLFLVIVGVFTYAIGNILFPELARLSASNEKEKLTMLIQKGLKAMSYILIPLTVGMIIFAKDIIKVLYQHGQFDENSTIITAGALMFYCIGMIGFGFVEIMNKSFYAKQDTKTPLVVGVIIVGINILLCNVFASIWGINGLALATACTAILNGLILTICANIQTKGILSKDFIISFVKILISSGIMALAVVILNNILIGVMPQSMIMDIVRMLVGATVGVVIYYICAMLFKLSEVVEIKDMVLSKIKGEKI